MGLAEMILLLVIVAILLGAFRAQLDPNLYKVILALIVIAVVVWVLNYVGLPLRRPP